MPEKSIIDEISTAPGSLDGKCGGQAAGVDGGPYDSLPVGHVTLAHDGAIRTVNPMASDLVHITRPELIGRDFGMLVSRAHRQEFREFLEQVFSSGTKQSGEFELAGAELPTRTFLIEALCPQGGLECSAIILDITGQKEAQEQMRVFEIRYRRLFDAAHDGFLLIDPESHKIIDANPFMTRMLGYQRDQLIGKELVEIGLLGNEAASRKMFRKLKRRHKDVPLENPECRHQEVEMVANLYQENGRQVIQCDIRDITARKQAEDMLHHNVKLRQEIVRRQMIEEDLRAHRKEQGRLLRQSRMQQRQLRELSHQILNAQEEERKRISRELHDVIAQNLVGINVNLALLTRIAATDPGNVLQQISHTGQIVGKALESVHHFARELRPPMLDDLGLIPALQAHLEEFVAATGIRVSLQASAKIDQSAGAERTVLYRIAQEALFNMARHSKASHAEICIESLDRATRMSIKDYGQGFEPDGKSNSKKTNRLGLIGMRERVEMIGGTFRLDSAPGGPTTILVEIPVI